MAVTGGSGAHTLFVAGRKVGLPAPLRFPLVRALDPWRVVLVDVRTRPQRANPWVLTAAGRTEAQFRVGDAVADVIAFEDALAVTYFDEAFNNPEGWRGVVVFDARGRVRGQHAFVDCYCACRLAGHLVLYLTYPEFDIVRLDVRTQQVQRWPAPEILHGASAITARGDVVFLHGPAGDSDGLYRWRLGAQVATRVGAYAGRLRGLGRGRFLACAADAYAIVTLTMEQLDAKP